MKTSINKSGINTNNLNITDNSEYNFISQEKKEMNNEIISQSVFFGNISRNKSTIKSLKKQLSPRKILKSPSRNQLSQQKRDLIEITKKNLTNPKLIISDKSLEKKKVSFTTTIKKTLNKTQSKPSSKSVNSKIKNRKNKTKVSSIISRNKVLDNKEKSKHTGNLSFISRIFNNSSIKNESIFEELSSISKGNKSK